MTGKSAAARTTTATSKRRVAAAGQRSPQKHSASTTWRARTMAPLKTVGHATTRIDACERVTGKATYTRRCQLPGMLYARVLRSPHPHARIRRIDVSKALAMPGVKAIVTHENCTVVWGAGSVAGGVQYNDEIKKITKQRRYAFNNPVRFVGEPVAAVAAVDRHIAEEALRHITVEYEVLPFVLDPEEALKPGAVQIWPEGNLSLDAKNEAQADRSAARQRSRRASQTSDQVFEDRYSTAFVHNAQMEPRASRRRMGGRQAHRVHAHRRHRELPHRHGARFGHSDRKRARRLPVHGRQLRQQESESGCGPDRGDAGQAGRRAGEAGALAQGRFHRHAWPLADHAVLQGRRQQRRHAARRIQLRGYSGMGPYRKNSGAIGGVELYQCSERRDRRPSGLHQQDGFGEFPRTRISRKASSASSR